MITESQEFLSGINFLIVKNSQKLGINGSYKFNKSLKNRRKYFLNKWFDFFLGIHSFNEKSKLEPISDGLDSKINFSCLILQLNNTRQFDLKSRLECSYNEIIKIKNYDIYPILQFLLLLQNTADVKLDESYHFEDIKLPLTLRLYGDSKSVNTFNNSMNLFEFYPDYLFSQNNSIRDHSSVNYDSDGDKSKFMSQVSTLLTVKSSVIEQYSSGYCSEVIQKYPEKEIENKKGSDCSIVIYPFSEFCGKKQYFSEYWEKEFMAEWKAYKDGSELPRRFVWENRGRNVGSEKPRITEWNPTLNLTPFTISMSLFMSRYGSDNQNDLVQKYINVNSVPLSAWFNDIVFLRLGLSSPTFNYDTTMNKFHLSVEVPAHFREQLNDHVNAGTIFARLSLLINHNLFSKDSLVRDRFICRMLDIVSLHREVLSSLNTEFCSLTTFNVYLEKLTLQIEYLGFLFDVDPSRFPCWPKDVLPNSPLSQGGISLLKHFYFIASNQVSNSFSSMTFYLLEGCMNVVLEQLSQWIFQGSLWDRYHVNQTKDFFIENQPHYTASKDHKWWTEGYKLHGSIKDSKCSWIFEKLSREILRCGKSMKLLSLIDDLNPLIRHPDIIKCQPLLRLSYSYCSDVNSAVLEYVKVVESVTVDYLKSKKERSEEKQRIKKLKLDEATNTTQRYLLKDQEKQLLKRIESQKQKQVNFDFMKEAAENEILRKREIIDKEKAADKALIEMVKEQNRDLLEEIKLEMTKIYAKKFADAEAREKISLEKIRIFENKLMNNAKKFDYPKFEESGYKLISDIVNECVATCSQNENEKQENGSKTQISIKINKSYQDEFKEGNKSNETISSYITPSATETSYYEEIKKTLIKDPTFSNDNSTASLTNNTPMLLNTKNKFEQSKFIEDFKKINTYGHSLESTAQCSLYPDTSTNDANNSKFMEDFKSVNTHGTSSDSKVQLDLYPDVNTNLSSESHFISDFKKVNIYGHSSESTMQESLYPDSYINTACESLEESKLSYFRSINTKGHASESTIQDIMYPLRVEPSSAQTNNNATMDKIWPLLPVEKKSPSDFVNSFYTIDFKSLENPINRSFLSSLETKRNKLDDIIELEEELLESMVDRSLTFPIMTQVKLVDSAIMETFFNQFHLKDYLKEIRKFLFLQNGHFTSALLPDLFDFFSRFPYDSNQLHDIIKSAINCNHIDEECYCDNVTLSPKDVIIPDKVMFNNKLDDFSISYNVKWPLNIIINNNQIYQYQSICRAVLQMKYATWCLSTTRKTIKTWYSNCGREHHMFRPMYSCLNEMEHWIRSIDFCLGNQVSGIGGNSWKTLMTSIDNGTCSNLDALIEAHSKYLDDIVIRCLLGGDHTECRIISAQAKKVRNSVRKFIISILSLICEYHKLISVNHWQSSVESVGSNSVIVKNVVNLHERFKMNVDCLLKILRKSPQDSYLCYLLLSLNFNDFYYKPTLV